MDNGCPGGDCTKLNDAFTVTWERCVDLDGGQDRWVYCDPVTPMCGAGPLAITLDISVAQIRVWVGYEIAICRVFGSPTPRITYRDVSGGHPNCSTFNNFNVPFQGNDNGILCDGSSSTCKINS